MRPLEKTLRNRLERTVREARDIAEAAARAALEQLGVGDAAPYAHLSAVERELRRRLRVHARQLGDGRNGGTEVQEIARLIEETAYEHWHRMLFARFLSENHLLMYPDPDNPVAVTLEECEDLAAEEGAKNGWELASRFAARMLPQIFRPDSPVFELTLPPEHQQKLERLLDDLPLEVFTASDSLGWVYQFWQARKKDEVNASEVKIGARELPAVTQLFTEPYMVSFLLDNSLGAWWVATMAGLREKGSGKELRPGARQILRTANSEEELQEFFSLSGVPLEYLRFIRVPSPLAGEGEGEIWVPAAGTFDGWPLHLSKLKTLDPCCGSGHFLVAALLMLVPMRMELEGLSAQEAVDAVLRDNLHGLEIDRRCVELAAFALALTVWRYPDAGGYRQLPELNVACSGLSVSVTKEEWKRLANGNQNLRIALDWLYDEFQNAPLLGSLINPARSRAAKIVEWDELAGALEKALNKERPDDEHEAGVVAQGLTKAANMLSGKYQWVITNVPYLSRGKQNDTLKEICEKQHPEAKNDLATVFLDRCLEFCVIGGATSIVLPQNWLFLTSYRKFREKLLKNDTWNLIARLGPGAFETISGEVVKAILITLTRGMIAKSGDGIFFVIPEVLYRESIPPIEAFGDDRRNETFGDDRNGFSDESPHFLRGIDVSEPRTAAEKAVQLVTAEIKGVEQAKQLENPDARVALEEEEDFPLLSKYADGLVGLQTSDDPMFITGFWELDQVDNKVWEYLQGTPETLKEDAGASWLVRWEQGKGLLLSLPTAYPTKGLKAIGKEGIAVHRMRVLFPYRYAKERFHQNVAVIIPYNPAHLPAIWCFCSSPEYTEAVRRIDQKLNVTNATLVKVPFDLNYWTNVAAEKYPNGLPKPYSDDPTQWIFHGHPARSDSPLQVAMARLMGYRWPAELDLKMELSDEARAWVKRCDDLLPFADKDSIVCIPPVRGEAPAADRLLNLLAAAYGDTWSSDMLSGLLRQADHAGKTLETWLREKFFTRHCRLFHHRPFIWHIWDGLRDGFAALVNYHKLDHKNLETLIYTYLGDWISRQRQDITNGVDGARERLAAAEGLKKRLELILEGEGTKEKPYDIFIRWKPIEKQPIGWDQDLNDGVRLNIRPFMSVPDAGKRGAGVLRDKPNISWEKDRGKDVASAPWYHLGLQYGGKEGDRINAHHLSLADKSATREAREKENRV